MITIYEANRVLDMTFGKIGTPDNNIYIGLSTTPITNSGTGVTEPVGGGYSRVMITNNKTSFTTATNGRLKNAIEIKFPESTIEWGTIRYIFIADALTGGNIRYYDKTILERLVQSQTTLIFPINSIEISMENIQ